MGLADLGSWASSALGVTAKAIIEITDIRNRDITEVDMEKLKTGGGTGGALSGTMAKAYIETDYANKVSSAVNKVKETIPGVKKDEVISQYLKSATVRRYEVMFNPSEIRIGGYGGGKFATTIFETRDDVKTDKRSSSMLPSTARITFSAKLMFDKTQPSQAFLSDRLTLNASRVGKELGKVVKSKLLDQDVGSSIQPEVEAFIAALRDPGTRMVSFNWGDMHYEGILNQANAVYTMFNLNGQPCRGYVDLTILCADDKIYDHSSDLFSQKYDNYWNSKVSDPTGIIEKEVEALNG